MARYSTLFRAMSSLDEIRQTLAATLSSCDLNLVFENQEYMVAKEKPGGVKPAQLATVEVLINPPTASEPSAKVNVVVKNEELPLRTDNHCHKLFELVHQAIAESPL